jgi:hypothetical protein
MPNPTDLAAPLVSSRPRTEGTNVETAIARWRSGRLVIPDYQRDADQWDIRKESLFIESLINNLTIPAFFFAENEDGTIEVVDGQQRLSTIIKYANDEFSISDDDGISYLSPHSVYYRGKKFSELPESLKNVFNDYPLSIIYLPRGLDLTTKLEIFRRINEGGTPLTAQDIRLSYYSDSRSVFFVRLSGIHADTEAAKRVVLSAMDKNIKNPWDGSPAAWESWKQWWEGKAMAKGQTPSEMFLWYLVALHRKELDALLSNPSSIKHLPISFRGSTEEALDIYCAQLQYTDLKGGPIILPTYGEGLERRFAPFAEWIHYILDQGIAGISVDKYKQTALLIGAGVELNLSPKKLSPDAWDAIAEFLRNPRKSSVKWLPDGYPEQKGRWGGQKGQKAQCDMVVMLLSKVIERFP